MIQCWGLKGGDFFTERIQVGVGADLPIPSATKKASLEILYVYLKKKIYIYVYICIYTYFHNGFHPIHLLVMNCAVSYKKQQELPGVQENPSVGFLGPRRRKILDGWWS